MDSKVVDGLRKLWVVVMGMLRMLERYSSMGKFQMNENNVSSGVMYGSRTEM